MNSSDILLKNLNPSQLDAVQTLEGPLLILAGAGSGKTRVLTHRIANLIVQGKCSPQQILAVTFTNKAAREMEHRTIQLLYKLNIHMNEKLWISTFHSSCVRILREHIEVLEYDKNFVIYDSGEQLTMVKRVLHKLNINDKVYPAKVFLEQISNFKMLGKRPESLSSPQVDEKTLRVYKEYQNDLLRANALDFDDLLVLTVELFIRHPDILSLYQERFRYILIDEYQDTNAIQYKLVKLLASGHQNICVVGDEDQSIYSWRGADIQNILSFEVDFPKCQIIKLEENYRSTKTIVQAATELIQKNLQRKGKVLFTNNEEGEKILCREEATEYDEARFVAQSCKKILAEDAYNANDIAIFYRTNAQSRVIEEQLRMLALPYKIIGGLKFYERMEIKDMLGYLRLLVNPKDDMAFLRVINTPTRGIGKTTVEKLEELAQTDSLSMLQACEKACSERIFNLGTTKKLQGFFALIGNLRQQVEHLKPAEMYELALEQTAYLNYLRGQGTVEADTRADNVQELHNAIRQFENERGSEATLSGFLEEVALVSDTDAINEDQNITLMTLHISKGLEFPIVFIVGMEEGLFPGYRATENEDSDEMEEERRLAYVGMTRARKKLIITHARQRKVWGDEQHNPPSRFIQEIPAKYLQLSSAIQQPGFISRHTAGKVGGFNKKPYSSSASSSTSQDDYSQLNDYYDESTTQSTTSNQTFKSGARVQHPVFGAGVIYKSEGSGDSEKVTILFDTQQMRSFILKYARLSKI